MKRGRKMLTIIFIIAAILVVIMSGIFVFLGRSQTISVKSIDNVSDNLYVFRFEKPHNMSWNAGSYIKVTVPNIEDKLILKIKRKITVGLLLHLIQMKMRLFF